jgi:cAMP-dependent protein kinase regulator
MTEKRIPKESVTVIHQGDVGDFFYVVEEGSFDFYIRKSGSDTTALGERVGGVGAGGSFGELALMYNAPRAASVVSTSPGVLWALDRITFRRILMDVCPLCRVILMNSIRRGRGRCMRRSCQLSLCSRG